MDKKIGAIIIDDAIDAINILKILLTGYNNIEVKAFFTNPQKALNWLRKQNASEVDAIFLDMEMKEMHGLNVAERINEINPDINIIFVTSFADFAVQAFELNSLDYLVKPVTKSRLNKTIERLTERFKSSVKDYKISKPGNLVFYKVYIQYLGDFNISIDNGQDKIYLELATKPIKETCAFLAHNLGKWVKREVMISAIWPDKDYEKSKVSLYSHIYSIKKAFLNIGLNDVVQSSKTGYRLRFSPESVIETDIAGLEELLKEHNTITLDNIENIEKSLEIYHSANYMGANYYTWTAEKQYEISAGIYKLLQMIAAYYQQTNDIVKLEALYNKAIHYTLETDWAYYELINLYLQQGRNTEAMRVYRKMEAALKAEEGMDPDERITNLLNKHGLL